MMHRRLPTSIALAATAAVGALLLIACGGSGSGTKSADGKPAVVASFYPMQYLAEQIGGDQVKVTDLTAAGTEPHDLELTAKQVGTVQKADVVLYLKGLQPTVDKAVAQSHSKHVVDAAALSPLVDHHLDEGTEETDSAGHTHEHPGEAGDPHLWLDPTRYAAVAQGVGAELAKADPAHAATYQRNTADLVSRLTALDQSFTNGLKGCTDTSFVTSHAAFGYLADHYGLHQIAINGVDPESEPTPARMAQIQQTAKANGVTTIFFETLVSPKLADSVAKDLNLKTAVLDPLEGVKSGSNDDYFSIMQRNLTHLRSALGCAS
ncbi:metal ABC transporter solute-binding protein, Zn/Mn family [Kitasatospora kifunensis]|uniref:Zinc transport system substrate-binding protein n=1 Tax=Kitasatospora kifunensis TaxID=58351 RepID=A0A7W7R0D3_KITKI|nr:zinc ABC transporter substrate-binding protein [Kitasatospora kifunensis]MBB4923133.1 zinc transport system substrate-binding protein [Kitasatospora kifunensis]